jgi:hypothetical protein
MTNDNMSVNVADRLAVADVIVRYFELVDAKCWDQLDEVFTEDTTARWTPDSVIEGCDAVAGAMRHMSGSEEIVTYHHIGAMTPVIDGDTAHVVAHVRAMHSGRGAREGLFYESLAVQPTDLVRTSAGWRISHHDWNISVIQGDLATLFAPEIAAGRKH